MGTTMAYQAYMGILEKNMEATIGFRDLGLMRYTRRHPTIPLSSLIPALCVLSELVVWHFRSLIYAQGRT